MDDFYKSLKDNLENRAEPHFEEGAWIALDNQLNKLEQQKGRVVVWPWWSYAMLALLPLSVILNAWLFWQNQQKTPPLITTTTAIDQNVDTIFQTSTVYQFDTIYRTQIIREQRIVSTDFAAAWKEKLKGDIELWSQKFSDNGKKQTAVLPYATIGELLQPRLTDAMFPLAIRPAFGKPNATEEGDQEIKTSLQVLQKLGFLLDTPIHSEDLKAYDLPIATFRPTRPPFLSALQPQGFSAGLQGGLSHPFLGKVESEHVYYGGFQMALQLPGHVELWGEVGRLNINFKVDEMGEELGIPVKEAPGGFDFNSAIVSQARLHYAAGLKYRFSQVGSKWRPVVELGYGGLSFLPYEIYYKFQEPNMDNDIRLENHIDRKDGVYHYLITRAGYEMALNKRWQWQIMGEFRYSFSNDNFTNPHMLGLKTGLSFQF